MAAAVLKNRNGREERFDIAITIYTGQVWLGLRRADMRSVSWGLVRGGGGGIAAQHAKFSLPEGSAGAVK